MHELDWYTSDSLQNEIRDVFDFDHKTHIHIPDAVIPVLLVGSEAANILLVNNNLNKIVGSFAIAAIGVLATSVYRYHMQGEILNNTLEAVTQHHNDQNVIFDSVPEDLRSTLRPDNI